MAGAEMHDVDGKLLNGIKSMHVNKQACVIVKGGRVRISGLIVV